jgi:hypothetical protein
MTKKLFLLFAIISLSHSSIGAAALFEPIATLTPTIPGSPTLQDDYGHVLYFHDDTLFVGAISARPDPDKRVEGAVYVYKRENDQWINTQILVTNGMSDHFSAFTIKAFDDWLFVSAIGTPIGPIPHDTFENQNFTGSIQIYRRNKHTGQYSFYQAIDRTTPGLENLSVIDPAAVAPNPPPIQLTEQGAVFGFSFDLDPTHELLLVGAATQQNTDRSGNPLINSGVVFAFKHQHNQWVLIQTLYNPDGVAANDTFGGVVKISKNYALISNSAIFTDVHLNTNTSVYLYQFCEGQWHFLQKIRGDQTGTLSLFAPSLTGGEIELPDNFGAAIAFDGQWALIGAPFENLGTNTVKGAAYLFRLEECNCCGNCRAQLVRKQKIISDDPNALLTGSNVALQRRTALVADPTHTGPLGQTAQGAILVYHRQKEQWRKEATLFDPNGDAFQLFSNGLAVNRNLIFGGTGTVADFTFLSTSTIPPLLDIPLPLQPNKVVIWKRYGPGPCHK